MFCSQEYQLVDFGEGRKLERFGPYWLDRPCPGSESTPPSDPASWSQAHAGYQRRGNSQGVWKPADALSSTWQIAHGPLQFELKPTEFGHVGLFPEQAANWDWIADRIKRAGRPLKVLNLFAYTGGSTLAAAAAGAEVVHVDAARNTVGWARRNAELSGLSEAPIRWIVEDALRFVRREVKRGHCYDAVILDPPSYGHGPDGKPWKIERHLPELLLSCGQLTAQRRQFVVASCHSPGIGPAELEAYLAEGVFGHCGSGAKAEKMVLASAAGGALPCGVVARWPA